MAKPNTSGLSMGSIIAIALIMAAAVLAFVSVQDKGSGGNNGNLQRKIVELQEELKEAREAATHTPLSSLSASSDQVAELRQRIRALESKNESLSRELKATNIERLENLAAKQTLEPTVELLKRENKQAVYKIAELAAEIERLKKNR